MWENFEESDVEESSSGNSLKDAIGNVAGDTRWQACKKSDNKPIQLRLNEVTQMVNAVSFQRKEIRITTSERFLFDYYC